MDEGDSKEPGGVAHDAPAVATAAEDSEADHPGDEPEETGPEIGGIEARHSGDVTEGVTETEAPRRRRRRRRRRGRNRFGPLPADGPSAAEPAQVEGAARREPFAPSAPPLAVRGILKLHGDHSGLLVSPKEFFLDRGDPFVPKHLVESEDLEDGLLIEGEAVPRGPKGPMIQKILSVEGMEPAQYRTKYIQFHKGISIDPEHRLRMETAPEEISGRVLDLVVPIGRGQRCLIVAPPKAGKTFLLKTMANAIAKNDPDVVIFMLLVDERPEEVTDMQRSIQGEVIASPSDMNAARHIAVSELCFERAKRLVEIGKDVVIFCDSITRMSRAYNNEQRGSGKILSGGIDARTMEKPRRFFGGARNHEDGGSLTIVATCLIDTGSRMDDIIFEEFKGTGNSEIILDRGLFERRIFPCINIPASGTRKEEKLYEVDELPKIHKLRRALASVKPVDAMELLLSKLSKFRTNKEFLKSIL